MVGLPCQAESRAWEDGCVAGTDSVSITTNIILSPLLCPTPFHLHLPFLSSFSPFFSTSSSFYSLSFSSLLSPPLSPSLSLSLFLPPSLPPQNDILSRETCRWIEDICIHMGQVSYARSRGNAEGTFLASGMHAGRGCKEKYLIFLLSIPLTSPGLDASKDPYCLPEAYV